VIDPAQVVERPAKKPEEGAREPQARVAVESQRPAAKLQPEEVLEKQKAAFKEPKSKPKAEAADRPPKAGTAMVGAWSVAVQHTC
jgi:hypothetical protein